MLNVINPMNSLKFTECDMKSKKSDLKIKKTKKPKNFTFQVFLKWVSTALMRIHLGCYAVSINCNQY